MDAGVWSDMTDHHIPPEEIPMALAELHRVLEVGSPVDIQVLHRRNDGASLRDVLVGAGFAIDAIEVEKDVVRARGVRDHTLADTVGAGMRLLVCGLNPSVYSAERGVGYARPGNRFWPAALAAGLVVRTHDAHHAFVECGVGMTDLCKRATVASAELTRDEYRAGAARVERLVRWLQPKAVAFVGLEGWRAAIDRKAVAGVQPHGFGGRPAYVAPSTSGLNAHSRLGDLVGHLRAAAALADGAG